MNTMKKYPYIITAREYKNPEQIAAFQFYVQISDTVAYAKMTYNEALQFANGYATAKGCVLTPANISPLAYQYAIGNK